MKLRTVARSIGIFLICTSIIAGTVKVCLGQWAEVFSAAICLFLGFLFIFIPKLAQQNQLKKSRKKEKESILKGECLKPHIAAPIGKFGVGALFCKKCSQYVHTYCETEEFIDREDSAFDMIRKEHKCKKCGNVLKSEWDRK